MKLPKGHNISIVLSGGADTDVAVDWRDEGNGGTSRPGAKLASFTAATTGTELLAGPGTLDHVRCIDTISIRNIDSSSQTVTVKRSDGTNTVEVIEEVLTGGSELHYDKESGWTVNAAAEGAEWTTVVLTADQTNDNASADTLEDVTGLSFAVDAGDTYEFEAHVDYTSAAATTGSRWTVNGPAMTRIAYCSRYTLTATSETVNYLAALQGPAAANASSLNGDGNVAKIHGFFTPSAGGTFIVQHASEVSASAIVAKAGSTLRYRRVVNA